MESSGLRRVVIGALKTHEGDIWLGVRIMGAALATVRLLERRDLSDYIHKSLIAPILRSLLPFLEAPLQQHSIPTSPSLSKV